MASFCDFELVYCGKHPLDVMRIVRDNMTISGLLELSYIGEHYIHLCAHRFNDEYYREMIAEMDGFIKEDGGEYEIISEDDMDCRVSFERYFPKDEKRDAE